MTSYLATPSYLKYAYTALSGKRRDKLDYILEPMQALLQLSLLGFSPVGSKLTITENLLFIQQPGMSQGIIRFFNDDTKEDLYYLFNVFRRFVVYYKHLYLDSKHRALYELLIDLSKEGLKKLIITYTNTNRINVLHTLQMYKVILDKPDFVIPKPPATPKDKSEHKTTEKQPDKSNSKSTKEILPPPEDEATSIPEFDTIGENKGNIDNIFNKIVSIYSEEELSIIHNTLLILQRKKEEDCQSYIDGLNLIMQPTYNKIKQWITDNIAL